MWTKPQSATIRMKTKWQYFPVVLFITLYEGAPALKSVDEILKWDQTKKSYQRALSRSDIYYAVQGGSNVRVYK